MVDNTDNQTQSTADDQVAQDNQTSTTADENQPTANTLEKTPENLSSSRQVFSNQQADVAQQIFDNKPNSSKKLVLVLTLLLIVLTSTAVGVFAIQNYTQPNDQLTKEQASSAVPPAQIQEQSGSETAQLIAECDDFPDMLESCTKYSCQFTHPLTGEQMTREIKGINNDKCVYTEQMPNDGVMDCQYTSEMRTVVASYYKDLEDSESFTTETSAELSSETQVNTTYKIDDKEVDNPLQEALDTGQCVVSGY